MNLLRNQIKEAFPEANHSCMFPKGTPVKLEVMFFLKRPEADFKKGKRGVDSLTKKAMSWLWAPITPDVDNLAKFVMDALSGLVYHDDRQVVLLVAQKKRDNVGHCMGHTTVRVSLC